MNEQDPRVQQNLEKIRSIIGVVKGGEASSHIQHAALYRNVVRNSGLKNSVKSSRHQWGAAVDFSPKEGSTVSEKDIMNYIISLHETSPIMRANTGTVLFEGDHVHLQLKSFYFFNAEDIASGGPALFKTRGGPVWEHEPLESGHPLAAVTTATTAGEEPAAPEPAPAPEPAAEEADPQLTQDVLEFEHEVDKLRADFEAAKNTYHDSRRAATPRMLTKFLAGTEPQDFKPLDPLDPEGMKRAYTNLYNSYIHMEKLRGDLKELEFGTRAKNLRARRQGVAWKEAASTNEAKKIRSLVAEEVRKLFDLY